MSLLDKIVSPVPPEMLVQPVVAVPGETDLQTVEGSVQPVLPGSATAGKPPLEFKPIPEADLPPLQNLPEPATATAEPPISEGEDIAGNPGVPLEQAIPGEMPGNASPPPAAEEGPRKTGRPKGSKNNPRPPNILEAGADPDAIVKGTAALTFNLVTGTLSTVLGPEWLPRDKQEKDFVTEAIAEYYRQVGVVELSPKTALCLVCLSYSLPRISQPNTKQKLGLSFLWFKAKCAWAWGKIFKRK